MIGRKMKKITGVLALSLAMGVLSSQPIYAEEEKPYEGETLTIMISANDSSGTAVKDAVNTAAEIMGIKVEYSVFPDDQFLNVLNTKGATGNLDDVIITAYNLGDMPYNQLAPLEGEWLDHVSDASMPLLYSPDGSGNVVYAPFGAESNMGLAYNKEVLEEAGVTLPLKNYQEFIDACEKIKAIGKTPVYVSAKETWTPQILLLTSFTGVLENKEGLIEELTTNQIKPQDVPEIVEIWSNVKNLQDAGYVNEDCLSATHEMGKKAIAEGTAAFYAVTDGAYGEISSEYPDLIDNVGYTICPMWSNEEDAYVMANGTTKKIGVYKDSENLDMAKEFVNTMLTEEPLTVYYEGSPGPAPFKDLGFELNMSDWNRELQELAESEGLPEMSDWSNLVKDGQVVFSAFFGDFDLRVQSLFAGVSAEDAVTQWYESYAEDAKARRLEGF